MGDLVHRCVARVGGGRELCFAQRGNQGTKQGAVGKPVGAEQPRTSMRTQLGEEVRVAAAGGGKTAITCIMAGADIYGTALGSALSTSGRASLST